MVSYSNEIDIAKILAFLLTLAVENKNSNYQRSHNEKAISKYKADVI